MIKKLLIAVVAAALLLTGAMLFLRGSLDSLVKGSIERYGSAMTGASIKAGKVEIRTADGQGIISNLEIGNPAGFKTTYALKVNRIDVAVDISTLTGNVILIRKIVIAAPDVIYEKGESMTNFDAIQKNIAAYLGPAKPDNKDAGGKKFIIEQLLIRDAKAEASAPVLAGKTISLSLPNITLKDVGKAQGGVTPGELGQTITNALKQKLTAGFSFDNLAAASKKVGNTIKGLFK